MRVLVVDDYEESAEASCLLLQVLGHEARHAKSGAAALEQYEAFGPDVLLLDIGLPDLSGYQIAREIRARSPERPVDLVGSGLEARNRRIRGRIPDIEGSLCGFRQPGSRAAQGRETGRPRRRAPPVITAPPRHGGRTERVVKELFRAVPDHLDRFAGDL